MERQPRRRRRPALSCVECRRRKIKCDRNDPCQHCVSAKLQCTFKVYDDGPVIQQHRPQGSSSESTSSPSTFANSPSANQPHHQAPTHRPNPDHNDQASASRLVQAAATSHPTSTTWGSSSSTAAHHPADTSAQVTSTGQSAELDLRDLLARVQRLEESSTPNPFNALSESGRDILARQIGLQGSQVALNKTRLVNWSRWMGTAQEFVPIISCYLAAAGEGDVTSFQNPETRAVLAQVSELLQRCKNLGRAIKVSRPIRCPTCSNSGPALPSREVADSAAAAYFRFFESAYRILHAPTFWAEYQRYWDQPGSASTSLRLKVMLVIAIGSSLRDDGGPDAELRRMVYEWVYTAHSWLAGPLKKDRLDIPGLQVHCLTILARQIYSIGGDLVWMSMGSLTHSAMQIGLHRDPKHLPKMPILRAEIRRRLWATILEMAVQAALDSAMPPRISLDEFDTDAPANVNDEEMDDTTATLQPRPKGTYTATSVQLVLLDSFPVRFKILNLLNGLHSKLSYVEALALSSDVSNACRSYTGFLQANEGNGAMPFHQNMLDYLVRRILLPLHYPFASQARANPLFYYSLKAGLDTAMALVSPELDESFSYLISLGGGMFREGVRCAVTTLCMELISQAETQHLDGTLQHNAQYRELLKKSVRRLISLALERTRQGETNIKSHTFLCMILAHADSIEAGVSSELPMAESARDSLELCQQLLQARMDNASVPGAEGGSSATPNFDSGQEDYGLDLDWDFFMPDARFS